MVMALDDDDDHDDHDNNDDNDDDHEDDEHDDDDDEARTSLHLAQCLEWRVDWLALGDTICDLANGSNGRHKKAHERSPWLKHAQLSVCGFLLLLVRCLLLIWLGSRNFCKVLSGCLPFGHLAS
jgi:hypothetical protein